MPVQQGSIRLLKEMSFIESNLLKGTGEEIASDVPAALADLTVRVIGARGGTTVARQIRNGAINPSSRIFCARST